MNRPLSICHTKGVTTDNKKSGNGAQQNKSADFAIDFFFNLLVSVVTKNAPIAIWLSHSPTITEYKSYFFLSLKDIK